MKNNFTLRSKVLLVLLAAILCVAAQTNYFDNLIVRVVLSVTGTTEATAGGAGSITTAGGIYAAKKIITASSVSTGVGGSAAGVFELGQGTAPSDGTNSFKFYADTVVTSHKRKVTTSAGSTGYLKLTVSGTTQTESISATIPAADIAVGALADGMTATTQAQTDNDTSLATTAFAKIAGNADVLGTFASPNTAAGAMTWAAPVYTAYTSTNAATRTYTLPAASTYKGKAFGLYVAVGVGHANVQPASGAALVLAGVLLTADHYAQAATTAPGNYIWFLSDGTNWVSYGRDGTWADASSP